MTISTPPFQASKWLQVPALLSDAEMRALFDALGDFGIYLTGRVVDKGKAALDREYFLKRYAGYIDLLKEGKLPSDATFRDIFSLLLTVTPDALSFIDTGNEQEIIRPRYPVLQLQAHRISYSKVDHTIRSKGMGPDTITWGIQFAYPQLFQDPDSLDIIPVDEKFPNTALFKLLQRWIRHHTLPTPFIIEGKKVNLPLRIGKECLSWINRHPQLSLTGLKIEDADHEIR